jgi:hypothetical protein
VSQETCPGWSKLALFARGSVAIGLAILARLFCWCRDLLLARLAERAWVAQVVDAWPSERRQECLRHLSEAFCLAVLSFAEAG